ncbi:MAG: Type 1 glutamine amidotransferase-like domain-containing protein [Clostridia bacterium]|nr:Type 1 glutamine amidotransferase-like domain-containing protein [Clostridia bacterium]
MICFLTSRIDAPETGELNPANHFIDELRIRFPDRCRALDICSNPDGWDRTDFYASLTKKMFEEAGFSFERFFTLDSRNEKRAENLVRGSNLLILSGGHVPTQNLFFKKIRLRELLKGYSGVVIGISAGSMNSADVVYSQPEEEGEAVDPAYRRFLTGLNLTKTNLLPHYQENKDDILDGLRIYDDIACPDSMGKSFFAIPDGSYLFINDGKEELRGEAYMVKDGIISRISYPGDVVSI